MKTVLAIVLSYLFGSIPWALIIGKVFYHKDIRKEGSGNLGASNAGRVLGKKVAVIVTVLDALKAFFSMLLASMLAPEAILFAGLACCVGHCFPLFANFKGGKAVATSYGFFLGIVTLLTHQWFWQFLFPILCFFLILYLTKMVSLSSICSLFMCFLASLILYFQKAPNVTLAQCLSILVLWIFVTYRHKDNLKRIQQGTENKIKWM
ncbi:MAG: glycerol-3-phosphate 1-O-acyltransferase PlsY [Solobacterium sp.]|nr:glycerol-3-phosphate 1-O-acyltransferase PlsY [Solobacterium sp.]